MIIRELRRRAHQFTGPSIALCAIAYFIYHIIQGDRGLIAWQKLEAKALQTETELASLQHHHDILENRVKHLRDDNLCPDLLNQRAKEVLGYIHPNELVVIRQQR